MARILELGRRRSNCFIHSTVERLLGIYSHNTTNTTLADQMQQQQQQYRRRHFVSSKSVVVTAHSPRR